MGLEEELRGKYNIPKRTFEGYIWVQILIKFNDEGKAEIVRSFTNPASDSLVKKLIKPKKNIPQPPKIEKSTQTEKKSLF